MATSAKDAELKGLLQAASVNDLMEEKATASDAKRSKPEPDIVQALNGAIAIYDGPADPLAHYDASPLGRKSQ